MTRRFALIAALALIALPAHAASVDKVDVHWTSHGAGPAIIFVHAELADEGTWSEQVPSLSRNYRVITLDLPG